MGGGSLFRNWGELLRNMYKYVCATAERVGKQVVHFLREVDWKKVGVTAGAIGLGLVGLRNMLQMLGS